VKNSGDKGRKDQGISTAEWKMLRDEDKPLSFHTGIPNRRRCKFDMEEKRILDFQPFIFHTSTDTTTTRFYLYLREKENRFPLFCGKGASRTPA